MDNNNNEIIEKDSRYRMGHQSNLVASSDINGVVTYVSPDFCLLCGYEESDLIGKPFSILRHPDMPAGPFKDLWKTLQQGKSWMGMIKNRKKDGGYFWVDTYITPVSDKTGKVCEYQCAYQLPSPAMVQRAAELYRLRAQGKLPPRMKLPTVDLPKRFFLASLLGFSPLIGWGLWQDAGSAVSVILLSILLLFIVFAFLGGGFNRLIKKSRERVNHKIKQFIYIGSVDDVGQLELDITMKESQLHAVVAPIKDFSTRVKQRAELVADVMGETSTLVHRQQQAIHSVTHTVDEFVAATQQVACSARQTANLVQQSQHMAQEGIEITHSTAGTMEQLAESIDSASLKANDLEQHSREIGTIIDVIQDIAEQTNLLALNAAIEAARAGENGRGFAVVADEVRSLAKRTHVSTQKINTMIEDLQKEIKSIVDEIKVGRELSENGLQRMQQTESALTAIIESVSQISEMGHQTAIATNQQSQSAESMRGKMHEIEEIVEQTSGQAVQTLRLTNEVSGKAQSQQSLVERILQR